MTQNAVVTKILSDGMAEVSVIRGTACGGNCGSCESCMFDTEIRTSAINKASALPGQKVIIETASSKIYGALFLVYILPFILFFIGYAVAAAVGLSESGCMLVSFGFFALGAVVIVASQRMKKNKNDITYEITRVLD